MPSQEPPTGEELPHELIEHLAVLADEPRHVAEEALALLSDRDLVRLSAAGAIAPLQLGGEHDVQEVTLTSLGRRLIRASSLRVGERSLPRAPHALASASLTDELIDQLVVLHDESDEVAGEALSLLGYGSLASLAAHGIIEPLSDTSEAVSEVVLTSYGRAMITRFARARGYLAPSTVTPVTSVLLAREDDIPVQLGALARFHGSAPSLQELTAFVNARLQTHPLFRQKLTKSLRGPFLEQWIDDSHFQIENHVMRHTLPSNGPQSLKDTVAELFARKLDRERPLWEVWLLEGPSDGFSVLTKTHHALVEGFAGVELLTLLFDFAPSTELPPVDQWVPRERSGASLVVSSVGDAIASGAELVNSARRNAGRLKHLAGLISSVSLRPRQARPSPLNVPIGDGRRIALLDLDLTECQYVKEDLGGTLSDLMLALLSAALREWMLAREPKSDPPELEIAFVFAREAVDDGPLSRRMTPRIIALPTDIEDRGERIERIQAIDATGHGHDRPERGSRAPAPFGAASALSLIAGITPRFNLAVADIPGTPHEMFLLDRPISALNVLAFVSAQHALTVAFTIYFEHVCVSLVGDHDVMHDIDTIADGMRGELAGLASAMRQGAPSGRAMAR